MWPSIISFFPCRNFCAENFVIFLYEIKLLFTYFSNWVQWFGEIQVDNVNCIQFGKPPVTVSSADIKSISVNQRGRKLCCPVAKRESLTKRDSSFSLRIVATTLQTADVRLMGLNCLGSVVQVVATLCVCLLKLFALEDPGKHPTTVNYIHIYWGNYCESWDKGTLFYAVILKSFI